MLRLAGNALTLDDLHGSFVDKGDAEMRLSVVTAITFICNDIIIGAATIG